jgi:predicted DNA-binding transcriptional regulator AlpA
MTDTERVELIRDILKSKVSPAAIVEAIKPIVSVSIPVVVPEKGIQPPIKPQDNVVTAVEVRQFERFLLLSEICERTGYSPKTIHGYRAKGLSKKIGLPPLIKRGDGRLGCLESELDKYMQEHYRKK